MRLPWSRFTSDSVKFELEEVAMELRVMAFTMLAAVSSNGSVWIDLAQFDTLNNLIGFVDV